MKELIKALVKAQSSFEPIEKDRVNPHYKSKYATLDSVLKAVQPSLNKNGLILVQLIEEGDQCKILVTRLYHESEQYFESRYRLPDIQDSQKLGSAISYAKRYSICAMLAVTADEDDDGQSAKPKSEKNGATQKKTQPNKTSGGLTQAQLNRLHTLRTKGGYTTEGAKALLRAYGFSSSKDVTPDKYDEVCTALENTDLAKQWNDHVNQSEMAKTAAVDEIPY